MILERSVPHLPGLRFHFRWALGWQTLPSLWQQKRFLRKIIELPRPPIPLMGTGKRLIDLSQWLSAEGRQWRSERRA